MIPRQFVPSVIEWFRQEGRVLPWRVGRDPYRIWISEVMLQQTRIEAVIPYYHRFLETLPNVQALAECPEDELLKLWEGLGYYSRARNLKRAAEAVVSRFEGKIPSKAPLLRSLPGIGDYTAGAIASIAFGEPEPAVDGNVLRVLTRYLADEGDIAGNEVKKRLTGMLREIYPVGAEAALLTEGIMEIGERVCIPNGAPLCEACPLKGECLAFREGKTDRIPVKSPKAERKIDPMTVFLLRCGKEVAIRKRGESGLLAGMWEFYPVFGAMTKKEAEEFLHGEGIFPIHLSSAGKAKHVFTHREWHMTGYFVDCAEKKEGFQWLTPEEIRAAVPIPTAFRAFLKKL